MQKITKKKVTQTEALNIVDKMMGKIYADFIGTCPATVWSKYRSRIVEFRLTFFVKEGSVEASVFFEDCGKLKK